MTYCVKHNLGGVVVYEPRSCKLLEDACSSKGGLG